MTTQEKVVGMVQEGRGVGGKLPGFFKKSFRVVIFATRMVEGSLGRGIMLIAGSLLERHVDLHSLTMTLGRITFVLVFCCI